MKNDFNTKKRMMKIVNVPSYMLWLRVITVLLMCFAVTGCGGSSNDEKGVDDPLSDTLELVLSDGNHRSVSASFTSPISDQSQQDIRFSVPINIPKNEHQKFLEAYGQEFSAAGIRQLKELVPHPELYCDQPQQQGFIEIADRLGGFRKNSRISIETDASAPRLLNGIEPVGAVTDEFSNSTSPVNIQRPNILGQSDKLAFYLSDIYGLVVVDLSREQDTAIEVSCGLPLPGIPINFVTFEDTLIVLSEAINGPHSGMIRFKINDDDQETPEKLEFLDALFFENEQILDARLFNHTLALYTKELPSQDLTELQDSNAVTQSATSDLLALPTTPVLSHQLKIIQTQPSLKLINNQVFLEIGEENKPGEESDSWSSQLNHFLSASGEYLVVSETKTHSYVSHYETRNSYRCLEWDAKEEPYRYCSVNWKRIENPDYEPPVTSGVINCEGDLLSCIHSKGPTVNRYIHIPDGETCFDSVRTKYFCEKGQYERYEVPVYQRDDYTQFHVFRFQDGQFINLDDTLATLDNHNIKIGDRPFQIIGRLKRHDHIHFTGNELYSITSTNSGQQRFLNTFTIQGNSAIHTDHKLLGETDGRAQLAAYFTIERIYVSESISRSDQDVQWSDMQILSLDNPLKPIQTNRIRIPTGLDQLFVIKDSLIGIGDGYISSNDLDKNYFGSITRFNSEGQEVKSLILGSDYQIYASGVRGDDLTVNLDEDLERLMLPYSGYQPIAELSAPPEVHRLSILDLGSSNLDEEHTFALPVRPKRTLSSSENLALSFSDEFIHALLKNGAWQEHVIFDGELPDSIYYTRAYPSQVQKVVRPDHFKFNLIDSADGSTGQLLDSIDVDRASRNICIQERVYFDQDRILLVRDKPGLYFLREDCPESSKASETELIGIRITETRFEAITDNAELEELYRLIEWNIHCVTDINNRNGQIIEVLPSDNESIACFTNEQYNALHLEQGNK